MVGMELPQNARERLDMILHKVQGSVFRVWWMRNQKGESDLAAIVDERSLPHILVGPRAGVREHLVGLGFELDDDELTKPMPDVNTIPVFYRLKSGYRGTVELNRMPSLN